MDRCTRGNLVYWHRLTMLFDSFSEFAEWSLANGYEYGKRLCRIDDQAAWSPENAVWEDKSRVLDKREKKLVAQWDEFITPIRERFKRELAIIQAEDERKRQEAMVSDDYRTVFFRYEHPDLEREGIVFNG